MKCFFLDNQIWRQHFQAPTTATGGQRFNLGPWHRPVEIYLGSASTAAEAGFTWLNWFTSEPSSFKWEISYFWGLRFCVEPRKVIISYSHFMSFCEVWSEKFILQSPCMNPWYYIKKSPFCDLNFTVLFGRDCPFTHLRCTLMTQHWQTWKPLCDALYVHAELTGLGRPKKSLQKIGSINRL